MDDVVIQAVVDCDPAVHIDLGPRAYSVSVAPVRGFQDLLPTWRVSVALSQTTGVRLRADTTDLTPYAY